jgi:hypothetical protein
MAGSNLVKISKMTSIAREYNSIRLLGNSFYLDYGRLPGDLDKNNRIEKNILAEGNYYENIFLWRELLIDNSDSNAGVLPYRPANDGNNNLIPGTTVPSTKYNPNTFGWDMSYWNNFNNNILTLSSFNGNGIDAQSIPAIAAQYADNKIDDGKPLSGSVFSTLDGTNTNCNSNNNNEYDIDDKDAKCFLAFWNNPLTEGSIDSFTSSSANAGGGEINPDGSGSDSGSGSESGDGSPTIPEISNCAIDTASLIPSDRNLKVVWYKSTDTNKTTPLADGSQINDGDIITADADCKNNILYTDMSDFDNDNKNELMYGISGTEYFFRCSDGALTAEGTPGTKVCKDYIPAHILYAATGTNDGIVINNYSDSDYNNGGVNDCTIDWGDGKTSVCLKGNNPHTYSSAGNYHIRIYGEKFIGFCFDTETAYCGSAVANSNYQPKLKKLYSMGKWNNTFKGLQTAFGYAGNLNEISKNTFKYLTEIVSFENTFYNCSNLTSIPAGLFDYNTKIKIFYSAFERCANLTSIPADLFKYNTEVTSFSYVFKNCTKLSCSDITSASTNWPRWNASGVTMTNAASNCKQ